MPFYVDKFKYGNLNNQTSTSLSNIIKPWLWKCVQDDVHDWLRFQFVYCTDYWKIYDCTSSVSNVIYKTVIHSS